MLEGEWEQDRIQLYQTWKAHPEWSKTKLARHLGHSVSWVYKWLKRLTANDFPTLQHFKSASRAPKTRPRAIVRVVWDAILDYRDTLSERYGRVIGPKTIAAHLQQDATLQQTGAFIPRSPTTLWKILREAGRIQQRVNEPHPVERPEPMTHWEMDFGQLSDRIEFLSVVDRGTSILVDTQSEPHYNAESALLAVAELLLLNGLPERLRFDNDPRFVGSALTDGFPSPLMRFLLGLGVKPDRVEPGKPYHKPFVERSIRTLKKHPKHPPNPPKRVEPNGIRHGDGHEPSAVRPNIPVDPY